MYMVKFTIARSHLLFMNAEMHFYEKIWERKFSVLTLTRSNLHNLWSGICGETSYRKKRLTLAECGRNGHFKNKW